MTTDAAKTYDPPADRETKTEGAIKAGNGQYYFNFDALARIMIRALIPTSSRFGYNPLKTAVKMSGITST